MKKKTDSPNFLTCPAFPALPSIKERSVKASPSQKQRALDSREQIGDKPPKPPTSKAKKEYPDRRPKTRWRKSVLIIGGILVVLFLIAAVPPGIALGRAAVAAQSAKGSINDAKTKLSKLDIAGAKADLARAQASLGDVHDRLSETGFWQDVPGIGTQLHAVQDASTAGQETIDGIQDLLNVFQVVTDALQGGLSATGEITPGVSPTRSFNDLSKDEKRELLQRFADALPDARLAQEKINIALDLWDRVPQDSISSPIKSALKPLADTLPVLKKSLDEAVPLMEAVVPLAGYPTPTRYLVVLQNSDELRPGGGFIGNVGTVTFDAGDLSEFAFTDIYNIDNPASYAWKEVPPAPISTYLGVKNWYLRDANWSPDFPTSAARFLDFYHREVVLGTGKPLANPPNAVLAFEPQFFQALLRLTGPITVSGQTYSADNFFDLIEYQVEEGYLEQGIPLANRKDVIPQIGAAMVDKLKSLPSSRWPDLLDTLTQALDRKQIQMYSSDPSLLGVLDKQGWTGRTQPTLADYLQVVDANLAALKTDGVMQKNVSYKLDATDANNITATVTLTYTNTNKVVTWRYTRYQDYVRVYVPEGSQLISTAGAQTKIDVTKELGKSVFGTYWVIQPGKTGTMSITYKLPPSVATEINNGTYTLTWPKQAGADETKLTLDLSFGKNITAAEPSEDPKKFGDARYEYSTDSLQDRVFNISWK